MESSSERKELLYIILFLTCFSLIMEFIKTLYSKNRALAT